MKLNQLRDYWTTGNFHGHKDLSSVMGRDRYLGTRECLRLHPYMRYSDDSNKDPRWNSRFLLDNFNQSSVDIDTPYGVSSFDEITIRCNSRCLAKSYIKNKPNPYGRGGHLLARERVGLFKAYFEIFLFNKNKIEILNFLMVKFFQKRINIL